MPPVALIQSDAQALQAAVEGLPEPLCRWQLPPLIVMEKGESLDEFAQRSAPDFFTSLQVRLSYLPFTIHLNGRTLYRLHMFVGSGERFVGLVGPPFLSSTPVGVDVPWCMVCTCSHCCNGAVFWE